MPRGGYRAESFPWGAVKPERRVEKVRAMLREGDVGGVWALLRHHLTLRSRSRAETSPHTFRSYRTGLTVFFAYLGSLRLDGEELCEAVLEPGPDLGDEYVTWLQTRGASPSTINNRRASAKAFYRALRWAGATTADPFGDVAGVRDPVDRAEKRKPYTKAELEALLAAGGPEDRALLLLMAHGTLRNSDTVRLSWSNVDLKSRTLTVVKGKGGKTRSVPMSKALVEALTALPGREGKVLLSFPSEASVRRRIKRLCRRAGVEYKAAHSFRHYAGTRIYQKSKDLHATARLMGHSNIQTSAIYAKHDNEALRGLVEELD